MIDSPAQSPEISAREALACEVLEPRRQTMAVVFASPHSGTAYAPELLAQSRLDLITLRRSEDAFVDRIFAAAPEQGAPLLRAHFPRVFLDANREAFELDPAMFAEPLPGFVNARSTRVTAGLGTIARLVANGETIYAARLPFAEAERRVETYYRPYHEALSRLVQRTRDRFGAALLVDCHSMPSIGGPMDRDPGLKRVDFVLGDCHGRSCHAAIPDAVESWLKGQGYVVTRNMPYAGGYTTQHYGGAKRGRHALQIEINRRIYMDERRIEPNAHLEALAAQMTQLIGVIGRIAAEVLGAKDILGES